MGMTMDTGRADMIQAVLEGVAFAMRDSLEVARSHWGLTSSAPKSVVAVPRAHSGARSWQMF